MAKHQNTIAKADTIAVNTRLDVEIVAKAEMILAERGLTLQDLFRMVTHETVRVGGIPWPLKP